MAPEWKKVDVPQGRFIGWGKKGQTVTVDVLDYEEHGGKDFNGNICPQFTGTLVEDCDNYLDKGTKHERLKAGDLVTVTCGLVNLKKAVKAAEPTRRDMIRMVYADDVRVTDGTVKVFEVFIAKGAGGGSHGDGGSDDTVSGDDL